MSQSDKMSQTDLKMSPTDQNEPILFKNEPK